MCVPRPTRGRGPLCSLLSTPKQEQSSGGPTQLLLTGKSEPTKSHKDQDGHGATGRPGHCEPVFNSPHHQGSRGPQSQVIHNVWLPIKWATR